MALKENVTVKTFASKKRTSLSQLDHRSANVSQSSFYNVSTASKPSVSVHLQAFYCITQSSTLQMQDLLYNMKYSLRKISWLTMYCEATNVYMACIHVSILFPHHTFILTGVEANHATNISRCTVYKHMHRCSSTNSSSSTRTEQYVEDTVTGVSPLTCTTHSHISCIQLCINKSCLYIPES